MITHRGLLVHPDELDDNWLDKCVSLGLNVVGLHPVGGGQQLLLDAGHPDGMLSVQPGVKYMQIIRFTNATGGHTITQA